MELNNDGFEPNAPLTFEQVQALSRKYTEKSKESTPTSIPKKQTRKSGAMSQEFAESVVK